MSVAVQQKVSFASLATAQRLHPAANRSRRALSSSSFLSDDLDCLLLSVFTQDRGLKHRSRGPCSLHCPATQDYLSSYDRPCVYCISPASGGGTGGSRSMRRFRDIQIHFAEPCPPVKFVVRLDERTCMRRAEKRRLECVRYLSVAKVAVCLLCVPLLLAHPFPLPPRPTLRFFLKTSCLMLVVKTSRLIASKGSFLND